MLKSKQEHYVFSKEEAKRLELKASIFSVSSVWVAAFLAIKGFLISGQSEMIGILMMLSGVVVISFGCIWMSKLNKCDELTGEKYKDLIEMIEYMPEIKSKFIQALNEGKILRNRDYFFVRSIYTPLKNKNDKLAALNSLKTN
ncbi:hypothetical protein C9928_05600 [Pseudidiomarina aestuarii]|uniref:Uncharacterized protein n=1 Tax=Pseudidiomarina aestuarii TaxID=624146 RepID=A0A6N4DD75_9GAMM|nr:hypothetical protein C9928_05600 [Pseudidiomarina aestuarii]PTC00242.1 hypothetical protein C9975_08615 [Thalassospira xiamenensis]